MEEKDLDIEGVTKLEQRLKDDGIISPYRKFNSRDLKLLDSLIKTEYDWNIFYNVWKENKNKYHLFYILILFRNHKNNQLVSTT